MFNVFFPIFYGKYTVSLEQSDRGVAEQTGMCFKGKDRAAF